MTTERAVAFFAALALTGSAFIACSGSGSGAVDAGLDAAKADASVGDSQISDTSITDTTRTDTSSGDAADASPVDAADSASVATPTLTALSVSFAPPDASAGSAMVPPFSPTVHDYYVRCSAGTNTVFVSMTAAPGSQSSLVQPTITAPAPTQTLSVSVSENQAVVAAASQGASSAQYWVRCLPHDFPLLEMTAHPDAGTPPPGYYLVGNLLAVASGGYAMVLDGNGVPVWYDALGTGLGVIDVDAIVAGAISFVASSAVADESFEARHLSPVSTTTIAPTGFVSDTHELRLLPNGNYLVLSYPLKTGVDLTGLSISAGAEGGVIALGPNSTIQDCAVVEFDPSGTVVSTWRATDHFDPAKVSEFPLTGFGPDGTLPDGGTIYDVFHCNSIDVDPANGNLLVSAREMDSIFYIDKPTGAVLWKMGGANASLDNATYISVADPFYRQHDARLQPGWDPSCNGGSGQISLFDDESLMANPARAVVYDVVVGETDAGAGGCDAGPSVDGGAGARATVAWQYKGLVSTLATGSFRISADGSRVIGWGIGGTPDLAFTEVDLNGNDLLDFSFLDGNTSYRAIKVPLSTFDLGALRSAAGAP